MAERPAQPLTTADDLAAIERAAMDYAQGWYNADAERVRHSAHPQLVKRAFTPDPKTGEPQLREVSRDRLVELARQGGGSDWPRERLSFDIAILDVYGDIACVRAETAEYVDYLEMARGEDGWALVNVLFAYKHP